MKPLKNGVVPLTEVEKGNDPDDIECLNEEEPSQDRHQFVPKRRRESQDARDQYDGRFHAIATCFNRYCESRGGVAQYASLCDDGVIERQYQCRTQCGEEASKGLDDRLLNGLEHLDGK